MDMKWDHRQQLLSMFSTSEPDKRVLISSFQMLTFSSEFLWCILQKEPRTGTLLTYVGHESKWWLTPTACFQSGTWSLPVSWLWCYHPLLDVSQWCLLNQNQSRCSWHHPNFIVNLMHTALSLNLQLPTPASIFSFCGKGVHKCITVPSEEFWQTFAH